MLIKTTLKYLEEWLFERNIGKTSKKRKQIAREIFWITYDLNLTLKDLQEIKKVINQKPFTIKEGNFWLSLKEHFNNDKLYKFFRSVSDLQPIGLNKSPNAACGKIELAFLLLHTNSTQPKVGDICLNGTIIELKGNQARISSQWLTGQDYRKITYSIFKDVIAPNETKNGNGISSFAFEIEKKRFNEFYIKEFHNLKAEISIKKFKKLFNFLKIDGNTERLSEKIFERGFYNQKLYQQCLLDSFFEEYKKAKKFDVLILFGNGTNVKFIKNKNDLKKCDISKDYFRIHQSFKVGWYIH